MVTKTSPSWPWRLRFLRGFATGLRSATGPHTAVFDLTTRCNLQCFACPRHAPGAERSPAQDFPWAEFQRLCPELTDLGVAKLVFIGEGEPLLHPHLTDMVALAKRSGFYLVLVTNGSLLDGERADAFLAAGLDELRVSLWASTPEEYARNCAGNDPRLFARVLAGVKHLGERRRQGGRDRPHLTLHRPIERECFRGLPAMVGLAREAGCDALSFSPLKPIGGLCRERGLDRDEERELLPILRQLDATARAQGITTNVPETLERYRIGEHVWQAFPCYMGWIDVRIRANGDVMACGTCRTALGNLHGHSLWEIWNGATWQRFRRVTQRCEDFERAGLDCDCGFCCHALTNARMHRMLRWLPRRRGPVNREHA